MADAVIRRLRARYRLPPSQSEARRRLDALIGDVAEAAVADVVRRAGLRPEEELCIRRLSVRAEVRLGLPDGAIRAAWANAVSARINEVVSRGGPAVVRYASRVEALLDVAASVAVGDTSRAWAWRQLELWRVPDGASDAEAAEELARVLADNGQCVVPVLRSVAAAGRLSNLVRRLRPAAWTRLAAAALEAAGARVELALPAPPSKAPAPESAAASPPVPVANLTPWMVAAAAAGDSAVRRAIAVFAALDAEPVRLRSRNAAALLQAVERRLVSKPLPRTGSDSSAEARGLDASADRSATLGAPEPPSPTAADHRRAAVPDAGSIPEPASAGEGEHWQPVDVVALHGCGEPAPRSARDDTGTRAPGLPPKGSSPDGDWIDVEPDAEPFLNDPNSADDTWRLVSRRSGRTAWGGLLFLLGIVDDLGIPDRIASSRAVADRPFRWSMHRLALELVNTDPADPAVLAFAGIRPGEMPEEWAAESAPRPHERRFFRGAAAVVANELHEAVSRPGETPADTVSRVCAREADIVADPGWFDVRLPLDSVETDIRRAGLDLDPGYVPWLGIVVRFVYE